jgi:CheY-like chemotaxis protein
MRGVEWLAEEWALLTRPDETEPKIPIREVLNTASYRATPPLSPPSGGGVFGRNRRRFRIRIYDYCHGRRGICRAIEGSWAAGVRRLLLVDDDKALRQSLAEQLSLGEQFDCREADSGRAALELAGKERFDAALLDVGLPDMDGREVCRLLRRAGVSMPIIMLTAADSDSDTILGLESGANDYVAKPFRMGVLLARLRA